MESLSGSSIRQIHWKGYTPSWRAACRISSEAIRLFPSILTVHIIEDNSTRPMPNNSNPAAKNFRFHSLAALNGRPFLAVTRVRQPVFFKSGRRAKKSSSSRFREAPFPAGLTSQMTMSASVTALINFSTCGPVTCSVTNPRSDAKGGCFMSSPRFPYI
ncbi:hypothetical protein D3C73_552020 [compost metagenome]